MNVKLKALIGEFSYWRLLTSAIIIPLLIYVGLGIYAYNFSERLIFQPRPSSYQDNDSIIKLVTQNGDRISVKHFPVADAKYTILFSHGNAEDIGQIEEVPRALNEAGFSVLTYDYHGYGTSEGKATIERSYDSIDTAYNYLVRTLKIPASNVIVHGRSLGGAIAIDVATRKPCGGLIVENSFVTAMRVFTTETIYPFDSLRNIDKVAQIRCPALYIHGKKDGVIPFWHGEQLFKASREPKSATWLENAGHNDVLSTSKTEYMQAIQDFSGKLSK